MSEQHNKKDNSQPSPPIITVGHRRRRTRKPWQKFFKKARRGIQPRLFFIGFIIAMVISTLTISILITSTSDKLAKSWESLHRVLISVQNTQGTELTLNDFLRLQTSVDEMHKHVDVARSQAAYISWLGRLNSNWQGNFDALDATESLLHSASSMLNGLEPTLSFLAQGENEEAMTSQISSGERVVELLELGQGQFRTAEEDLARTVDRLNRIELATLSPVLLLRIEQLYDYHTQISDINTILLNSPDLLTTLLGFDEEKSYLVLAQNNDEIRPSGGYISTYGWFTIRNGRITHYDYSPTTSTSPNPPDENFLEGFYIPEWWIQYNQPIYAAWDGSWYTDYPSTARMAMDYYNAGGNPKSPVDGAIAIDITGFELILGALGDVFVEDYNRLITAENFRRNVYDIRAVGLGENQHKEFVAALYQEIFSQWRTLEQAQTPQLLGALLEGVQRKHILIFFDNEQINQTVGRLRWNGAQAAATEHDYLLVADANLGNKSNHSIDRSITYDVQIQPDNTLHSRLSIRYEYYDSVAMHDPAVDEEFHGPLDYRNLLQIFLPSGSHLTQSNSERTLTSYDASSHLLLATRTEVAYDSNERFQFVYETPALIHTIGTYQQYRLLLQKQPGARSQRVDVQVALPQGAQLIDASPIPADVYVLEHQILDFRLDLDQDIWVEVIYRKVE